MRLNYKIASIISCCLLLVSCSINEIDDNIIDSKIYIQSIKSYSIGSRGDILYDTTFGENDTVLFNSFGAHTNINHKLTYNGTNWNSDKDLKWNNDSSDSITYSAIFPTTYNNRYTTDELYEDGRLKDIIFCKSKSKYQKRIDIKLSHLFSILKIDVSNVKDENINSITMTLPTTIDSISLQNGTIYTNPNKSIGCTIEKDANGICAFVIPSLNNISIGITLNCDDKTIDRVIKPTNYNPGYIYSCSVLKKKDKGIKNSEDFIAFTNLINNKPYQGRTIDEFYYEENGRRVFTLINNIYFTEEELLKLNNIGNSSLNFNDIFDGNNKSIYNLNFSITTKEKALFGYIGQSGMVRNLRVVNSTVKIAEGATGALLSFRNNGVINNCIIDSCRLYTPPTEGSALFSLQVNGTILNSAVTNTVLDCGSKSANGLFAKALNGNILNCYAANNRIVYKGSENAGIFAFQAANGANIVNCYEKCTPKQSVDIYKIAYRIDSKSKVTNCFVQTNYKSWYTNDGTKNCYTFNDEFKVQSDGTDVISRLNEWIDNNQHNYSDFIFNKWKYNTTAIPAIHI